MSYRIQIAAMCLVMLCYTESVSAAGFAPIFGYRYIELDYAYSHDTHPDDSFLPGSATPGSAGTTNLDNTDWLLVGGRFQLNNDRLTYYLDLGLLFGTGRNERKNANDSRPDASAAFIYSKATYAAMISFDLIYDIKPLYIGADFQLTGVYIESGWDRFGSDENQDTSFEVLPTIGPKIGYQFDDGMQLEATIQFGESVHAAVNWNLGF